MNKGKMDENQRFHCITDMKTVALIGVVLGHCMLFYAGNPFFPETAGFTSSFAVWVCAFLDATLLASLVFCSGFLFAHSVARKKRSMVQCLINRTKRILIPYYVYGTLWVVPLDTFFNIKCFGRPENAGYLTGYRYMLLGCFSDHLWFLWMLFWIVLAFILMKPLLKKKYLPVVFVISTALALIVQLFLADFPYFKLSQTGPYFLCYFAGVCAYHFMDSIKKLSTPVLLVLTAVFFAGSMCYNQAAATHFLLEWLCKLCGAFTSFFFFVAMNRFENVQKIRETRLWRYTDAHSMQLFLFNCPFVYLYFRLLKPLIGQYFFLCVLVNFIATTLTMYGMVWIQNTIIKKFREMRATHAE